MKDGFVSYLFPALLLILLGFSPSWAGIEMPQSKINLQLALAAGGTLNQSAMINLLPVSTGQAHSTGRNISQTKAIGLSLLLPGAGHFYIGEKGRGEVFMGAEAVSWIGAAAFYIYGKWREDDYRNYASVHAGVSPDGKDDDFYRTITFYDSREEFNGRGLADFPEREYYPNIPEYDWQWDSPTNRESYRGIRNSSKAAMRNATFMIGVAVANRILASIDTFRLLRKFDKKKTDKDEDVSDDYLGFLGDVDFRFSGNPFGSNPKVNIKLVKNF